MHYLQLCRGRNKMDINRNKLEEISVTADKQ